MSNNTKDPFDSNADDFSADDFNPSEFDNSFAEVNEEVLEGQEFATEGFEQSAAAPSKKGSAAMDFMQSKKFKMIAGGSAVVVAVAVALGAKSMKSSPKPEPRIAQTEQSQPVDATAAPADQFAAADQSTNPTVDPFTNQPLPSDPFAIAQNEQVAPGMDQLQGGQVAAPGQADPFVSQQGGFVPQPQADALDLQMVQAAQGQANAQQIIPPTDQPGTVLSPMTASSNDMGQPAAANGTTDPFAAASAQTTGTANQPMPANNNDAMLAQLQQQNQLNLAKIAELERQNKALQQQVESANTSQPTRTDMSSAEKKSMQRQINALAAKNRKLEAIAKKSAAELEKIAKGETSEIVKSYQKASGIEQSAVAKNESQTQIFVRAISKDLAVMQKDEKLHYVKKGDVFDGITVVQIDPRTGKVLTNRGTFSTQ